MIKKPLTKKPAAREVEEEEEVLSPKERLKRKKAAAAEESEEEEAEEEEEEAEEPAPKSKLKKKAPEPEEEEEEAPRRTGSSKKKVKSKKSLADLFDKTKPGRSTVPNGEYKACVKGFELIGEIADDPDDQDDLSLKVVYEIHEDEEEGCAGKSIQQRYQIFVDGEAGQGIGFLKADLEILGYEDVTLEDLQEIIDDIEAESPVVVIKTKQNGGWTNVYLQGLAEDGAE